jgi:RNA recognition motif-containing protein
LKIGDLKVCRFDRNEFGQFLGSATVTYEQPKDALQAINEYNGAYLDDKVLTVEFDNVTAVVKKPMTNISGKSEGMKPQRPRSGNGKGKELRLHSN